MWVLSNIGTSGKDPACQYRFKSGGFDPWIRKIPWRRTWKPTPEFSPEKSHGQKRLARYSPRGRKESDTTEATWHTCLRYPSRNVNSRDAQTLSGMDQESQERQGQHRAAERGLNRNANGLTPLRDSASEYSPDSTYGTRSPLCSSSLYLVSSLPLTCDLPARPIDSLKSSLYACYSLLPHLSPIPHL